MAPDSPPDHERSEPVAVVRHDGQEFRFTHDDPADHIFSILRRTGAFYEGDMLQQMVALLHPGDLVLDVGANIGNHAVFLAGVCRCRVIAFEINPRAIRALEANVLLNGLGDRIRIEAVAVGAERQRGVLSEPREHNLGTGAVAADPAGDIEIVPIDDIAVDGKVALIKIDIEGTDIEALKGATRLLARDHPAIVIEAKTAAEYAAVAGLLDPLGYVAAGSFNYSPTHFFVRPPARAGKGKLVPQLSHRLALHYIDSMSRQSGVDQQLGRVKAQVADIASRSRADQTSLATQWSELQRVVDGFGAMLSALAGSLRDDSKAMAAQVGALLQRTVENEGEARRHLTELQGRMDDLGISVERSAVRAAEELATLRQEIAENRSTQSAAIDASVREIRTAFEAIHDRQMQTETHLAEVQRQAAAGAEAMARLENAVRALDGKGDAAVEATLLAAASQEADVAQLRRDIDALVDRRVAAHVEAAIGGKLEQLRTEIARSIGRKLGELRGDLDVLLGASNLGFGDALTLLGIDPNAAPPPTQAGKSAAGDNPPAPAHTAAALPTADEKRTWFVRRAPSARTIAPAPPSPQADDVLARLDFGRGWKDQVWVQRGSELRDGSLVVATEDKATLGFVSRIVDCPGGGLLEIEVSSSTVDGPVGGRILRLRSGADEPIGHDFPLSDGVTTIRTFAPHRTRQIKLYVLRAGSPAGTAFRVPSIAVRRLSADRHQAEIKQRVGQPVLASMASIPSRRDMLRDCVDSLLVQCDRVRVFLNEYPDVPAFLKHPRVEVRRSQDWDDRGDAGKFFWIDRDEGTGGYRLIVDDDLVFPPDFAATMTAKVAAMADKAIYAAHAVLLRQPVVAYYEKSSRATTFHFGHRLQTDRGVHVGATNAMCFHADAVRMRWSDFKYCNSADIWLSLHAQEKGLPVLTPARPRDWIRENTHANPADTIYNHSLKRTRSRFDSSLVQDAVIRHAGRFTVKARNRAKCGFALRIASADAFEPAMRSWLAWRRLDVEWVVFLVYDKMDAAIRAAVRSFEMDHEIHLVEVAPGQSGEMATLWPKLGVEAVFCAGDSTRFSPSAPRTPENPKAVRRQAVEAPPVDAEPLISGPLESRQHLTIQTLRGERSGATRAVVVGHGKDRVSWLAGEAAAAAIDAGERAPFDPVFAVEGSQDLGDTPSAAARAPAGRPGRVNDVFERVLVLNLDRRKDRWQAASKQLMRFGIDAERMSAVDGSSAAVGAEYEAYRTAPLVTVSAEVPAVGSESEFYLRYASQRARIAHIEGKSGRKAIASAGAWGYLRSYERVLERALQDQTESLLVFDDDVALHNDFHAIFADAITQLPRDWLIVQLGTLQYNWSEPWVQWRGSRLYQTNGSAIGSHAVGMRFDIYPFLLDHVRRMDMPYDVGALSAATRAFPDRCFVISPNLAIQRLGDSDIGTSGFQNGRDLAEIARTYRWNLDDYEL